MQRKRDADKKHVKRTRPRQEKKSNIPSQGSCQSVLSSVSFPYEEDNLLLPNKRRKRRGARQPTCRDGIGRCCTVASLSPRVPFTDVRDGLALDERL